MAKKKMPKMKKAKMAGEMGMAMGMPKKKKKKK